MGDLLAHLMSGSSSKLDDIVLTTFDNDKIFVIHPKTRRRSSTPTCLTTETELGESSLNILDEGDKSDFDNTVNDAAAVDAANRDYTCDVDETFEGHTIIDLVPYNPDSSTLSCKAYKTCWCCRGITTCFTKERNLFNWSILQTWYNMAFSQCMVPFFIRKNKETDHYEKVSFRPQQVLWTFSMVLLVVEMLSWIPSLVSGLQKEPNPYLYLSMTQIITGFLLRCCFLNLICCNGKLIIDYLNNNSKVLESLPADLQWYIRGRLITWSTIIIFFVLHILYLLLSMLPRIYLEVDHLGWTKEAFLYTFVCYGRKVYLWRSDCHPESEEPLGSVNILYGIMGLTTYANGLLSFSNVVLCLISCTFTLLMSAISIRQADAIPTVEKFELLNDTSSRLSNIVGGLLTIYMFDLAVSMPDWIRYAFQSNRIYVIFVTFRLFLLLAFAVSGCLASLYIDRIKSSLTEPQGIEQLPLDLRQFIGIFVKIFQSSVGIGFPGLFVLNFRLLFSYMGIICSVIVVVHETLKDMKNGYLGEDLHGVHENETLLAVDQ